MDKKRKEEGEKKTGGRRLESQATTALSNHWDCDKVGREKKGKWKGDKVERSSEVSLQQLNSVDNQGRRLNILYLKTNCTHPNVQHSTFAQLALQRGRKVSGDSLSFFKT